MKAILPLLEGAKPARAVLRVEGSETAHAAKIHELASGSPGVTIGSYPRREDGHNFVLLTFEAPARDEVDGALLQAADLFPSANAPEWVVQ